MENEQKHFLKLLQMNNDYFYFNLFTVDKFKLNAVSLYFYLIIFFYKFLYYFFTKSSCLRSITDDYSNCGIGTLNLLNYIN